MRTRCRVVPAGLLSALFLLGCGGKRGASVTPAATAASTGTTPTPPASQAQVAVTVGAYAAFPGTLSLPVPPVAYQSANVPVYAGTVTCSVDRSTVAGPVTFSVAAAALPQGVKAQFSQTTLPPDAASTVLTFQAGYPDPSDPTFTTKVYPALGTATIPVTAATAGAPDTVLNLILALVPEPGDFAVSFLDATQHLTSVTSLELTNGVPVTEPIMAYWLRGSVAVSSPVVLALAGVPEGLTVSFDDGLASAQGNLNVSHTLNLQAQEGLAPGVYAFQVEATGWGTTRILPVVVTVSPAPFALLAPLSPSVAVAQGQSLTFPMYLWHDGTFFASGGGLYPSYVGDTRLSVAGALPAGLTVGFPDPDPTGLAATPLTVQAAAGVAPGTYPVTLQAVRDTDSGPTTAPPVTLEVVVTAPGGPPALWVQQVEWGQTVLAPGLRLVGGKPALLRVQLLADRPGVPAPGVVALVRNAQGGTVDTVTLQGPAEVPMAIGEGDLASPGATGGTSFTAVLPAADLQPGLKVTLQPAAAGAFAPLTLSPAVAAGIRLALTAVPVIQNGLTPVLPPDAGMTQALTALWPLQGVDLTHRAAYTTATVLPQPGDPDCAAGWSQLLAEMASLRLVDGAASNYYGFFNPGITRPFVFATTGLSSLGEGVGLGIDQGAEPWFENANAPLDLATMVMVHEQGHAFNLNHAPAGGAGNPQLDFPYPAGGLGSWGFDPATGQAHDPSAQIDIMGYGPQSQWVSDWDYRNAQAWLGAAGPGSDGALAAGGAPAALVDQWVVSGWITPAGQVQLHPLVRVTGLPRPPAPGPCQLTLRSTAGVSRVAFAAEPVPDLPAGHRPFAFSVPAGAELVAAEVGGPGLLPARRQAVRRVAARKRALDEASRAGRIVVQETDGALHLAWDAAVHPYVNVLHEGAHTTTLALHLTGGAADLSLAGVPAGGRFTVQYSDGLNPVSRSLNRKP